MCVAPFLGHIMGRLDRRDFVKAASIASAASMFAGQASAESGLSTEVVDAQFDLASDELQDALVVFDSNEHVARLGDLNLADGFYRYRLLPIGFTRLTQDQIRTVADWDDVRRVKRAEELEWYNTDASRLAMGVTEVHQHSGEDGEGAIKGYNGEGLDVVVIDTGTDGSHPGLQGRVAANFQYVDGPLGDRDAIRWQDLGPGDSDEIGHGTHCAGIVAGDGGGALAGDYHGMAPAATITAYSTTQAVYLPYVVDAWDHMLHRAERVDEFDPKVVSNSYGVARTAPYNPNDPVNVASWTAFLRGILPVWAMGNDGPGLGTGNRFAKAPHVLGVAAAKVESDTDEHKGIVDFSSRGRRFDPDRASSDPTKYVATRDYHHRELLLDNLRRFWAVQEGNSQLVVDDGAFTGSFQAGVNGDPARPGVVDEESSVETETLSTSPNADLVEMTVSLDPEGQWLRIQVYEEEVADGNKVAAIREEPLKQHDTLTFDVEGETDYVIRIEPEISAAGQYTLDYRVFDKLEIPGNSSNYKDVSLSDFRPLTLYRPGISTHGVGVMSTEDPHDALAPVGPFYGGSGTEPFYHAMSGTSMACPAGGGIALLVYDAYRQSHADGEDPDPIDVIRILENTTYQDRVDYTPANTGAGFVDAAAAVELAEDLADRGENGHCNGDRIRSDLNVLVDPDRPS